MFKFLVIFLLMIITYCNETKSQNKSNKSPGRSGTIIGNSRGETHGRGFAGVGRGFAGNSRGFATPNHTFAGGYKFPNAIFGFIAPFKLAFGIIPSSFRSNNNLNYYINDSKIDDKKGFTGR